MYILTHLFSGFRKYFFTSLVIMDERDPRPVQSPAQSIPCPAFQQMYRTLTRFKPGRGERGTAVSSWRALFLKCRVLAVARSLKSLSFSLFCPSMNLLSMIGPPYLICSSQPFSTSGSDLWFCTLRSIFAGLLQAHRLSACFHRCGRPEEVPVPCLQITNFSMSLFAA
jgi:hypothetical protein